MELAPLQSEFVAAVTHEFKSPITSIRLLMERLKGKVLIDIQTARRLFTLICALHWKG